MSQQWCSDPNVSLGNLQMSDVLVPCPQLKVALPAVVALQLKLFTLFGYLKKILMLKVGIDEADANIIMSSPVSRLPIKINAVNKNDGTDSIPMSDEEKQTTVSVEESGASTKAQITKFSLNNLVDKYGDKKIRTIDALPRKGCHFVSLGGNMLIIELLSSTFVLQLQTAYFSAAITTLILIFFNTCLPDTRFTTYLLGVARVRDGKVGRWNLCVALTSTTTGAFVVFLVAFASIMPNISENVSQTMVGTLVYAPLVVGDAMGELIGGPFGGTCFPTFKVRVFGEINRKSVEGCFAEIGRAHV